MSVSREVRYILLGFLIVVFVSLGIFLYPRVFEKPLPLDVNKYNSGKYSFTEDTETEIYIYICGAVKKPGVYKLKPGSRVIDALKAAEGAIKEAELEGINLAKRLKDEDMIVVPRRAEDTKNLSSVETLTPKKEALAELKGNRKININSASVEELTTISGIGKKTAERIWNYRREKGRFQSLEELKNVPGIGEKTFEKIRGFIRI